MLSTPIGTDAWSRFITTELQTSANSLEWVSRQMVNHLEEEFIPSLRALSTHAGSEAAKPNVDAAARAVALEIATLAFDLERQALEIIDQSPQQAANEGAADVHCA